MTFSGLTTEYAWRHRREPTHHAAHAAQPHTWVGLSVKDWQNTILFFVGVGGAVLLLIAPAIGLESVLKNPIAAGGVTTILAYVLTQRNQGKEAKAEKAKKAEPPPPPVTPTEKEIP